MLLADTETKFDLLNNEAIARTVVALIGADPERAVTVGVHGDWGAGKSSVLEMIEQELDSKDDVLCIKFNAWRFQGFEDAKIALIEGIVMQLIEKRSLATKAADAVMDIARRIDWLKVARMGGGLALTAMTGVPSPDHIGAVVGMMKSVFSDPAKLADKDAVEKVVKEAEGLLKEKSAKRVPEEVEEFRKAFAKLLQKAGLKQLVVLIDDLDRCLPDPAIETLEAVRLFVMMERTAFVVAADEAMIEYSVRRHFPELPESTGPISYARNYLEKLIQVPVRIPALGAIETRIYVTLLLVGVHLGEKDEAFGRLAETARTALRRPWDPAGFDGEAVSKALGERATDVADELRLTEQVVPLLATSTQGNPRQIKRFLNVLLLRHRTSIERGFGDEVQLSVLAKLMLAERFIPTLFDQIVLAAANDPDGYCRDLASIEVEEPGDDDGAGARDASANDNPVVAQWKSSEVIKDWGRQQPAMSGLDLRPYLFVTKDRKDFLAASSALGPLALVVERLMGRRMTVVGMSSELAQLAPPEATKVFENLRKRVLATGDYLKAPPGVDGAVVLVRAQPHLQTALLDMIDLFPDSSGAWVVTGWQEALVDDGAKKRFAGILDKWSKLSNNPPLKTAAGGALRTGKA